MGSFKRALFGYRRDQVDIAIATRDAHLGAAEEELAGLSSMVIEREREIRSLNERLRESEARLDRSIASLATASARLEEIQSQARGQATRIRMKALREAVAVSRRTQELSEATAAAPAAAAAPIEEPDLGPLEPTVTAPAEQAAAPGISVDGVVEGAVRLEIGPLGDFSQLVGLEDAIGRIGASHISVERFSEGRATFALRLDEPVDLLRELAGSAPFDFVVRRNGGDRLILDLDEDEGGNQRAA